MATMNRIVVHRSFLRPVCGRWGRAISIVGAAACLASVLPTTGCRTSEDDVHRWANTAQGPRKLVAVVTHDKFPQALRVEAAMTLVRMKPRGGRRIGLLGRDEEVGLLDALTQMPPNERAKIVTGMVPELAQGMT